MFGGSIPRLVPTSFNARQLLPTTVDITLLSNTDHFRALVNLWLVATDVFISSKAGLGYNFFIILIPYKIIFRACIIHGSNQLLVTTSSLTFHERGEFGSLFWILLGSSIDLSHLLLRRAAYYSNLCLKFCFPLQRALSPMPRGN